MGRRKYKRKRYNFEKTSDVLKESIKVSQTVVKRGTSSNSSNRKEVRTNEISSVHDSFSKKDESLYLPDTTHEKCLICSGTILSSETFSHSQDQDDDELATVRLLCNLFKILKISPRVYKSIQLNYLPDPLYCTPCAKTVADGLQILSKIEALQFSLEQLAGGIRDHFIESYYSHLGEDESEASSPTTRVKAYLRKTLVQCWTTCTVRIQTPSQETLGKNIPVPETVPILDPVVVKAKSNLQSDNNYAIFQGILEENECEEPSGSNEEALASPYFAPDSPYSNHCNYESKRKNSPNIACFGDLLSANGIERNKQIPYEAQDSIFTNTVTLGKSETNLKNNIANARTQIVGIENRNQETVETTSSTDVVDLLASKSNPRRSLRSRKSNAISSYIQLDSEIESDDKGSISDSGSTYMPNSPPFLADFPGVNQIEPDLQVPNDSVLARVNKMKRRKRNKSVSSSVSNSGDDSLPIKKCKTLRNRRRFRNPRQTIRQQQSKSNNLSNNEQTKTKMSIADYPFKCDICGKGYRKEIYVAAHKKFHSGKVDYPCKFCFSSYSKSWYLTNHYITAHNIEMVCINDTNGALLSFSCGFCKNKYSRNKFIIDSSTNKVRINCDQEGCKKIFTNFVIFSWHHGRTCSEKPPPVKIEEEDVKIDIVQEPCQSNSDPGCNVGLKVANITQLSHSLPLPLYQSFHNNEIGQEDAPESRVLRLRRANGAYFPFRCKICSKGYRHKHWMEVHEQFHSGQLNFPCTECDRKFAHRLHLGHHLRAVHGHKNAYTLSVKQALNLFHCNFCDKEYNRHNYLVPTLHSNSDFSPIDTDTNISSKTQPQKIRKKKQRKLRFEIKCDQPDCHEVFCNFNSFIIHHRRTCSSNPNKVACSSSAKKCAILQKSLAQRKGRTDFPFRCAICGKGYLSEGWLEAHERFHRGEQNFKCTKCNVICSGEMRLAAHIETHKKVKDPKKLKRPNGNNQLGINQTEEDNNSRSYKCSFCDVVYDRKSFVTDNGKSLSIPCELPDCGKTFTDFKKFIAHHRYSCPNNPRFLTPSKFKCKMCDRVYVSAAGVLEHEITNHTKEYQVYCEQCGLGFFARHRLKEHQLLHHSEKKFKCELCPKEFKKRHQFTDHMNRHNNYFPYVCDACGKKFVGRNGWNMHMQQCHHRERLKS